jgi:hypothetical protein
LPSYYLKIGAKVQLINQRLKDFIKSDQQNQ